jgi:hypothetical protein
MGMKTDATREIIQEPAHTTGNGAAPPPQPGTPEYFDQLARQLLRPPSPTLGSTGLQMVVDCIKTPDPMAFLRSHPTLRLSLALLTPSKKLGSNTYAVLPSAIPLLARYHFEPAQHTLYPVVLAARPLVYKLIRVKTPTDGRDWDNWNLSKKLILDEAVEKWRAIRSIQSGYAAGIPDSEASFPEPEFPDWSEGEWLYRSFEVTDLLIKDESHPIFKEIKGL